jgi:hypothetical protein
LDVDDVFTLACPHQGDDPSNETPPQKEIEEEDGKFVVPFTQQGDNRGQEIGDKAKSKDREKEEPEDVHRDLLLVDITTKIEWKFP